MTEYIDLDLDGIGDSPIISQTPRYPGVKAEVTTRVDADMAFTDFNFTLPKAPVREPPAPSKTPPPPSEALPPPSNYPPTPRVVFSYHAPTSIHLGPTRVTTLPSFDCFGRDMVRETRGNWSDHLFKSPSSVFSLGRRPQSRPPLEGVLSKARENAKQISVPKALVGVRVVPSSAASVVMTVHSLMLSMLNGSFTMEQAACDFLLLSMIRAEVSLGVYSTPPQLVLQTRRRLTYLNNPRHKEEGEMVMRRLERLLKVWRAHWRPRPFSGCHGSIEGLKDKEEDKQISDKMQGDPVWLMRDRFVCGAGEVLPASPDPEIRKERMKLLEAVSTCLLAPQVYPAFVVWGALDNLNLNDKYFISFIPLKEGLDVHHSTVKTVFVRNWAVPFSDLPARFSTPSISDKNAVPEAIRVPPVPRIPQESAVLKWGGAPVKEAGGRRFFESIHVQGKLHTVGSDAYASDREKHTAKMALEKKVLGRVVQLWDTGEGTLERALIRLWVRKDHAIAAQCIPKKQAPPDYADSEVFATDSVVEIPAKQLRTIEVRNAENRTIEMMDINPPPEELIPDVYSAAISKRRLTLAASGPEFPEVRAKNKVIILNLTCKRRCDVAGKRIAPLRRLLLVNNRTPTPVKDEVKPEPGGAGDDGRSSVPSMTATATTGTVVPRGDSAKRPAEMSLSPPPERTGGKRLRLLPSLGRPPRNSPSSNPH